jgi:hypothetical protein
LSVELLRWVRDFLGLVDIARMGSCSVQMRTSMEPHLYQPLCLLHSTGYFYAQHTEAFKRYCKRPYFADAGMTEQVRSCADMFSAIKLFGKEIIASGNLYLVVRPWIYRAALRISSDDVFYDDVHLRLTQLEYLDATPKLDDAGFRRKARRVLREAPEEPDMRPFKAYENELRDKYEVHVGPDFEPLCA